MKQKFALLMIFFTLFTTLTPWTGAWASDPKDFKIIGYYSELLFDDPIDETLQMDKLTHIIYAFLIPKKDGTLVPIAKPDRLKAIVEKAHRNHVKVCIAVGGWSYENTPLYPTFEAMAKQEETRDLFVKNVLDFVEAYQLDGVEMDWEYPKIGQSARNYEDIVLKLKTGLSKKGKALTAAVNGAGSVNQSMSASFAISSKALDCFDWVSVMSYDVGTKQHAPYSHAETSIAYWKNRGLPAEKIVLGVPLYAKPSWMQYRHLIALSKDNAHRDYVPTSPLASWYNGIATIRDKTRLSLLNAGGIMLFDINEDTTDETSLLGAVYTVKKAAEEKGLQQLSQNVSLIVLNREITAEKNAPAPFIDQNGLLMIPLQPVLKTLNWGAPIIAPDSVQIQMNGKTLDLPLNENRMSIDGKTVVIAGPTTERMGQIYVQAKPVFESLGLKVNWHEGSKTAVISY